MSRRRLAARLGMAGGLLGVLAGLVQAVVGYGLPEWTGDKQESAALGALTILISLVAVLSAHRTRRVGLGALRRAGSAVGMLGPGLLGLTTVGRLWYLPAVLLVTASVLSVERWHETGRVLWSHWSQVLMSIVAGCQLLMVAVGPPPLIAIGAVSAVALWKAAWTAALPPSQRSLLVAFGVLPLAVLGWAALVPVLTAVLAVALVLPLMHRRRAATLTVPR